MDELKNYKISHKEVDRDMKLREALEGTLVYEFPTLYVLIIKE
jgi:hypothetical protein